MKTEFVWGADDLGENGLWQGDRQVASQQELDKGGWVLDKILGMSQEQVELLAKRILLVKKYGLVWVLGYENRATHRDGNNKSIFYKQEPGRVKVAKVEEGQWSGWQDSRLSRIPMSAGVI